MFSNLLSHMLAGFVGGMTALALRYYFCRHNR